MKSMARKRTSALNKLLIQAGVDSVDQLQPEEKATYERYRLILAKEVTVETIKEFSQNQLKIIESKSDGLTPLSMLQQACIHVYINFLKLIEAPEAERESLERLLNQMAETNPRYD